MNKYILIILFNLISLRLLSSNCTATSSGNWNSPSIWSCGHVPTCGDVINIPAGKTVTIDIQKDYVTICGLNGSPLNVFVYGTLHFNSGFKLKLPCNSNVYVEVGGSMTSGGGGGNSNELEICNQTVWKAGDGDVTTGSCFPTPCNSPLPIELISFVGTPEKYYNKLFWITATETNNDYFTIEKSLDAINFIQLAIADGAGTSIQTHRYDYSDENPYDITYYRLKQTDYNGDFTYSNIIAVENGIVNNIVVYPNPFNNALSIQIQSISDENVTVKILDIIGREIYQKNINITKGKNNIDIDCSNVSVGAYTIQILNNISATNIKLIKY